MITRLAWREVWKLRGALLLQAASLTVAIAAIAATATLRSQTEGGAIPGSTCASQVLQVNWVNGSNTGQDAWTPRQAEALQRALGSTLSSPSMNSMAELPGPQGTEFVNVALVGSNYFGVVCVPRTDLVGHAITAPFESGVVATNDLAKRLGQRALRVNGPETKPTATVAKFRGTQFATAPVEAWAPYANIRARGKEFLDMPVPTVHLLLRPNADQVPRLQAHLDELLRAQRGLFPGVEAIRIEPPLQINAWTASKVRLITRVLELFSIALVLLVAVNLLTYHAGRLPAAQALATTLTALGVPPRVIWGYAAFEPALVAGLAWLAAAVLSPPLSQAALAAVTNERAGLDFSASVGSLGVALLATLALTVVLVLVRGRVLTRRQAPSRSRAQRLLLRWLPLLLAVQVALGAFTLALAAQAGVGLAKAVPAQPRVALEGLTLVEFELPHPERQNHISLRWRGAWQSHGRVGYRAALSSTRSPFLPLVGWTGYFRTGPQAAQGYFSYVTPEFFEVLDGAPKVGQRAPPRFSDAAGRNVLVLNTQAAQALFGSAEPSGRVVRWTHELSAPGVSAPTAVVLGVYDDHIVGARGATGKFDVASLSMQAAIPLAYQPLNALSGTGGVLDVFVRHPVAATPAEISSAVWPAVHALAPDARLGEIVSAQDLFREPLRKERAMALVLGILAIATLAIGLLGMVSLMAMLLCSLQVELAVRYAVGATRREIAALLARRLASPAGIGLVVAIVPAAAGMWVLGNMLESAARAGVVGPAAALLALACACAAMCFHAAARVQRADLMGWLRYE